MEKEKRNEKQRKTGIGTVKTGSRKAGVFSASQGLLRPFWEILRQWREGLWEWFGGEENAGIGKKIGILLGAEIGLLALSTIVSLAAFPLKVYPAGFAVLSALSLSGKRSSS